VTVGDIVRRAGVARGTFYENFSSKDDCFLAAQEHAMSTALTRAAEAAGTVDAWPQRVRVGLKALLDYVEEEPALARTCMVEALAAGPACVQYYEESQNAFVSLLRLGRDVSPRPLPETLEEAIVGGVFWIVYQRLILPETGAAPLLQLLPDLTEFTLAPYMGNETAREIAGGCGAESPEAAFRGEV
jgi:AcrR family transcriptional regulator